MIILNPTNPLAGLVLSQIDHSIKLYSSVLRDHATPSLVQNHQWLLRLRARALSKVEHAPPPPGDGEDVDIELLGWRTRLVERARGGHRATNIASGGERGRASDASTTAPFAGRERGRGSRDSGREQRERDFPSSDDSPTISHAPAQYAAPIFNALGIPGQPQPTIDQVLQQHFVAADALPPPVVPGHAHGHGQQSHGGGNGGGHGHGQAQGEADPGTDLFLHQFWDPMTLLESREGAGGAQTGNWWNTWDLVDLNNPM